MPPRRRAPGIVLSLGEAVDLTRTGDVWIFRGRSGADRAIQALTNAPVNHVGMALVVDDLPPLMWHAELGRSLPDVWTGEHQRGVQLHDLRDAVLVWAARYGQQAWLRQLEPTATTAQTDAALRSVSRLDGTPFPSTAAMAGRWFGGHLPGRAAPGADLENAYCAEVVATTYEAMGLLPAGRKASSYDPGSFWSGDDLDLQGARLGGELTVTITTSELAPFVRPVDPAPPPRSLLDRLRRR